MDDYQKKNVEYYTKLTRETDDDTLLAARYLVDAGKEEDIWNDIALKIKPIKRQSMLDIGCGCGGLTKVILRKTASLGLDVYMMDIPAVIDKLYKNAERKFIDGVTFFKGVFPWETPKELFYKTYDMVLVYSVVQYTEQPFDFIEEVVKLLAPGGRALFGDIPNVNMKGRFLSSKQGRHFEAAYRNIPLEQVPIYRDQCDFVDNSTGQNKKINDQLLLSVLERYRGQGYNAYLLPEPSSLPFWHTREDLLIEKIQ
jgi:2-polyprenyl-3-methyl-5-hydroxy-6-metoxy-1,4-benzoquinol methylase